MKKLIFVFLVLAVLAFTVSSVFAVDNTTDLEKAIDDAQAQNKSVFIIFDQKSCVYCDMLKENTLTNGDVEKQLDENYIVVIVDINRQPQIAGDYEVFGTPTIVILDSSANETARIEGYVEADELLDTLKEI